MLKTWKPRWAANGAHPYQGEEKPGSLLSMWITSSGTSSILAHLAMFNQHYQRALHMRVSLWVSKYNNDRVATKEHLADESVLVHRFGLFLSFPSFWHLQTWDDFSPKWTTLQWKKKCKGICRSRPSSPANMELKVANNDDLLRAHK